MRTREEDLVDQVDGLIRQEPFGDIAGRKVRGRIQGFIGDRQAVVLFVSAAHAVENFDGLFNRRLVHDDGLEAALQGGIAFDVLAVLVQGGGADHLQLAA